MGAVQRAGRPSKANRQGSGWPCKQQHSALGVSAGCRANSSLTWVSCS